MTGDGRVPAVGGTRTVAAPDPVARDYLLLALRLDQHIPGLVDGYFGPADLKAQVDMEPLRSPARLRDDAAALRTRLETEVPEADRRSWLDGQLVALETQAGGLAGQPLPYLDHVARCFAHRPARHDPAIFDTAAREIATLLPGPGSLADKLAAWDARFEIPAEHLMTVAGWLVRRFREAAASSFGLPDGEDLRIARVTGQPWAAYNWYRRRAPIPSRRQYGSAGPCPRPRRAGRPRGVPGHHLEHAWKEADLVDRQGRLESSILLINTPECLISEGLADVGVRFVAPLVSAGRPARRTVRACWTGVRERSGRLS